MTLPGTHPSYCTPHGQRICGRSDTSSLRHNTHRSSLRNIHTFEKHINEKLGSILRQSSANDFFSADQSIKQITSQLFISLFVGQLTLTVLVITIDAQWEGMGGVGSARYELALHPPCPTIWVLNYSN